MTDTLAHTTGIVKSLSEEHEVEMILGPVFKLRRAGVVRPGIMVLKKSCSPEDHKAYGELLAQGKNWDEIEKQIGKGKLIPKNVDYFTIQPSDCNNPQDAETIYKLYADPDGKLRSFPVWFPINEWQNIIPHSLRCFGLTGLKYKCEIVNGEMLCYQPFVQETVVKTFGGRDWVVRKKCEPSICNEFQKGECKFGGVINCFVPGIKGMNQWIIPTTSWNSLANIKSSLELVKGLLGRVSGLVDGKPFFRIRKVKETVYHTDSEGKRTPSEQWIIVLDCELDPMDMARYVEPRAITERAKEATLQLVGGVDTVVPIEPPVLGVTKVALLERISKIQNIYEAVNWLKKHQGEIDLLTTDEKAEVMAAYDKKVEEVPEKTEPKPKPETKKPETKTPHSQEEPKQKHDANFITFMEKAKKQHEAKFIELLAKHGLKSIDDVSPTAYKVKGEIIDAINKFGKK